MIGQHRVLASAALLLVAGLTALYVVRDGSAGTRIDDRERDEAVCGTGDENNQCPGALDVAVVPNPRLGEYAVVWQGWYTGSLPDGVRLFARRFDAKTGQPKGASVELAQTGLGYAFAAVYDPATRTYVVAWQPQTLVQTDPQAPFRQVRVQRFDQALQPSGDARTLDGNWDVKALASEPGGRVAVVGAENEQPLSPPFSPSIGTVGLHVETIDAHDATVSMVRRDSARTGFANGPAAVYDRAAHSLLISWMPLIGGVGARDLWIDRIDANGVVHSVALPVDPGVPLWNTGLACNEVRHDCLLLYAGGGPALADLHARLLDTNGEPRGGDVIVAHNTRGPIGVGTGPGGYTFAWNQGGIAPPNGAHIIIARTKGSSPSPFTTLRDQTLPGTAQVAVAPDSGTGVVVWLQSVDHPQWSQIRAEIFASGT